MTLSFTEFRQELEAHSYLAEAGLATALYISYSLPKPLFLEGEPGVGKTEVAKVLAEMLGTRLIRVQCYRGLEANSVLYEWNYLKQIMALRIEEMRAAAERGPAADLQRELFSEPYLVERPLLSALRSPKAPVVLIDEIDRADEEFEAFLLEFLADFQVTVPEIGTITARQQPYVIITSNRTREVHDALRRRCLYYWIHYPAFTKELNIVRTRVPEAPLKLAAQLCALVQVLRKQDLVKKPGLAETLDWVRVLVHMDATEVETELARHTLGAVLKTGEDLAFVEAELRGLMAQAEAELGRTGVLDAGDGRC